MLEIEIFRAVKMKKIVEKKKEKKKEKIFLILFAQKIDCWYTLEQPRRVPTINVLDQTEKGKYVPIFVIFFSI